MFKLLSLMTLCVISVFAQANNIQVGQTVPTVEVTDGGEILLNSDQVSYAPWNTKKMLGKVRLIQAIAGRSSAKELNAPLIDALVAAKFPTQHYQATTIINQDDAVWGTGSFVKSSAENGKKDFPYSSVVLDKKGKVASTWQLPAKSSTIILQDKSGKVLFNKDGALTKDDINQVLQLIKTNL